MSFKGTAMVGNPYSLAYTLKIGYSVLPHLRHNSKYLQGIKMKKILPIVPLRTFFATFLCVLAVNLAFAESEFEKTKRKNNSILMFMQKY